MVVRVWVRENGWWWCFRESQLTVETFPVMIETTRSRWLPSNRDHWIMSSRPSRWKHVYVPFWYNTSAWRGPHQQITNGIVAVRLHQLNLLDGWRIYKLNILWKFGAQLDGIKVDGTICKKGKSALYNLSILPLLRFTSIKYIEVSYEYQSECRLPVCWYWFF